MGQPRPLFHLFLVFSNKQYNFLQQINVKKCQVHPGFEPTTFERESPPITTRPGLPPKLKIITYLVFLKQFFVSVKGNGTFNNYSLHYRKKRVMLEGYKAYDIRVCIGGVPRVLLTF